MTLEMLTSLFDDPMHSRNKVLSSITPRDRRLPTHGSSFFIHLSELCPVACKHCMYSSDLNQKTERDSLSESDLENAIEYIDASQSQKLNITGGGEPFLKFKSILRLLERVRVPRVEIVTAGYWATTEQRAAGILSQLDAARIKNPVNPDVLLRLSIDRYHIGAPKPVTIAHYANVAKAWSNAVVELKLGFRSIMPDRDKVDRDLANALGAEIVEVDSWNRKIVMPGGKVAPITFNILRFSGKASELPVELKRDTKGVREYYKPFETGADRLTLAMAVNDAIRGSYTASDGLALTLNSDGTLWIFCGTSPDRKLKLGQKSFQQSVEHFFDDPITHLLVNDGVWALAELVEQLDPGTHARAMAKNDVAFLVEDLLDPADVRLAVTLLVLKTMSEQQRISLADDEPVRGLLEMPGPTLLQHCQAIMSARRSR